MICSRIIQFFPKLLHRSKYTRPEKLLKISNLIDIHPRVHEALLMNRPVVALESTIITHGMPYPHNLETALEVEEIVQRQGSVPATIAIIDGRIKVGLTSDELQRLSGYNGGGQKAVKCSRRDLAYVLSKKQSGGTTVAGTLVIANMVGIKVFATGGIGGVHREGHVTFDISADLMELGKTPIAVVSSGVKSILDIPRTLEYLETQGVCVASYQSPGRDFPAFYSRSSGVKAPYNLESAMEAAQLIQASLQINLGSGVLIGVPIPEEFAIEENLIAAVIKNALTQVSEKGISGKEVTPFVLQAVSEITKGKSLKSNIALIKNNALIASEISVHLASLSTTESADKKPSASENVDKDFEMLRFHNHKHDEKCINVPKNDIPVVIGASILDVCLTAIEDDFKLDGATYQVCSRSSGGGVGRNVAEGLHKIHGSVSFISALGDDEYGRSLQRYLPESCTQGVFIDSSNSTSICTVIFDNLGDCKVILGDMKIHKSITPEVIMKNESVIADCPLVIMDGNIPVETMEMVLKISKFYNKPVFFEPTDMRIAAKPFQLPRSLTQQIKFISPNIFELKQIAKALNCRQEIPIEPHMCLRLNREEIMKSVSQIALQLSEEYFDCIILTLGVLGTFIASKNPPGSKYFDENLVYTEPNSKATGRFYPAEIINKIVNVSGAGDSFTSGFIAATLRGKLESDCVRAGFNAAKCALQAEGAVPKKYSNVF